MRRTDRLALELCADDEPGSKFRVAVRRDGVRFSIDHQAFYLRVDDDDETPMMERYRWYARQLRVALKRLAGSKPPRSKS